ncbi:MAG: DUF11 domain-containing protein, partial [Pseudomonadota bacterium]
GQFATGAEQSCVTLLPAAGVQSVTLSWPSGLNFQSGYTTTYLRLRLSANQAEAQTPASAGTTIGEVEDYRITVDQFATITGTVFEDTAQDGTFDGAETQYQPVTVRAFTAGPNAVFGDGDDVEVASTDTAAATPYTMALPAGTYEFRVDTADTDIPASHIAVTPTVIEQTVAAGQTYPNLDFGFAAEADLSLRKTVAPAAPADGDVVTYTLIVTNSSGTNATGVEVRDLLPAATAFDSATGTGTYASATGLWTVGTVPANSSVRLDIITTVSGTSAVTNTAEITASDQPDADSIPGTGAVNGIAADDGRDGDINPVDDDEAQVVFTIGDAGIDVTGTVFFDTGTGAGVSPHDGSQAGTEAGTGGVRVEAVDAGGSIVATTTTLGDGSYTLSLPTALVGSGLTIRAVAPGGTRHVSGATTGAADPDATDGAITFTLATGTAYQFDFGLVELPRLTADQTRTVAPSGTLLVPHTFTATSAMDVVFAVTNAAESPAGAFTTLPFYDEDCNGVVNATDAAVAGARSFAAGDQVCVLVRVVHVAPTADGASLSYDLEAQATYTATTALDTLTNTDRITVNEGAALALTKAVCNATTTSCNAATGAGFGVNNAGRPGDVLVYRIVFEAPGPDPIDEVAVHDRTPDYSALTAVAPGIVLQPNSVACALTEPAMPAPNYAGDLEWGCPGSMVAGDRGIVSFEVKVAD